MGKKELIFLQKLQLFCYVDRKLIFMTHQGNALIMGKKISLKINSFRVKMVRFFVMIVKPF